MYTKCLRSDLEYKTLGLSYTTTCTEVISILLSKYRMRHRDPNLFYMTMEITLRKIGKLHNPLACGALPVVLISNRNPILSYCVLTANRRSFVRRTQNRIRVGQRIVPRCVAVVPPQRRIEVCTIAHG